MDQIDLNPDNIDKLDFVYNLDPDIVLNNKQFESKEGFRLSVFQGLSSSNDSKINNHSILSLTDKMTYDNIGYIATPKNNYPETFTTYLAANVTPGVDINDSLSPQFIGINPAHLGEANKTTTTCSLYINSLSAANYNYFEIQLIDEDQCKISHYDNYKTVYLTYNGTGFDFQTVKSDNSQLFSYVLDRDNGYITLYKRYTGSTTKLVNYSAGLIQATNPLTNPVVPPESGSIFKIRIRPKQNNKITLSNDWYSYDDLLEESDLTVSECNSYTNLSNNIMVNTEYENISGTNIPFNFTPLKNQLTAEYNQSRNNPFPNNVDVDFRDYNKIFSGVNQIEGSEKISMAYENHTRRLKLKAGSITYFHMPQDIYPYERININDSGLSEAGAIGSDNPLNADKIFKKKAGYKSSSNFGDSIDEQSGVYLCSWLLNSKSLSAYFWVDRYYNPDNTSEFQALSTDSPLTYTTDFETIDTNVNTSNYIVYDKLSNLTLEPGSLYAYHRIGQTDVESSIEAIPNNIQSNLDGFQDSFGGSKDPDSDVNGNPIYSFDGTSRAKTSPAEDIISSSNLAISFHMHSDDWSEPFGYQIIGNYIKDGFGVFNKQAVTPFITIPNDTGVHIFNTDFKLLNTIPVSAAKILRGNALDDMHLIHHSGGEHASNGKIISYDLKGNRLKEQITLNTNAQDTFMYKTSAYALVDNTGAVYVYDLERNDNNLTYRPHSGTVILNAASNSGMVDYALIEDGAGIVAPVNGISVTDIKSSNGDVEPWIGAGYDRDVDIYDNQWKILTNKSIPSVIKHDTANKIIYRGLSAIDSSSIECMKTDIRGDVWVVYNSSQLAKISNDRNLIFSTPISSTSTTLSAEPLSGHKTLDFIREFDTSGLKEYCIVLDQIYTANSPLSAETTCYYFNMSGGFVKQVQLPVNITKALSANNLGGITNYDYVKRLYPDEVQTNKLTFKTKSTNKLNEIEYHLDEIDVDVTDLKPGTHHFTYIIDNDNANYTLYVDNLLYKQNKLPVDNKYRFSDIVSKSLTVGASPFFEGSYLSDALAQPGYYNGFNFNLKLFNIFNRSIGVFDVYNLYKQNRNILDLEWVIPGGKRGYIETIDRFNKHRLPGHKTNFYETTTHTASSLSAGDLIEGYEKHTSEALKEFAPINNKQIKSTWFYYNTAG